MFGKLFSRSRNVAKLAPKKTALKPQKYITLRTRSGQLLHAYPVGVVDHFYDKISVVTIKVRGMLHLGELIFIRGKSTKKFQKAVSMQHYHKPITKAQTGDDVGIKVVGSAEVGDVVYRCIINS